MRVISGTARGTRLYSPKGTDVRPTSDRVKESLFNIIGDATRDALVLDLFAGSGALGIESLSRGARRAYFVDQNREAVSSVSKNLELTKLADRANIIKADALRALEHFSRDALKFDLIFLDPPYRISVSFLDAILDKLASDLLSDDGLLILEHSAKTNPSEPEGLRIGMTRAYGDTAVTLYHKKGTK